MSINVRGLADDTKRREVFYWLRKQEFDIYMLQETHSTDNRKSIWRSQWGGEVLFSHGESNSRGVCILFSNKTAFTLHNAILDKNGRYIVIDITLSSKRITLANVYGPNDDNPDFFMEFFDQIESFPNDHRIIGGDFNFVFNTNIDKYGGRKVTNHRSSEAVKTYMEDTDLVDIWRQQNPGRNMYTWCRKNPEYLASRLDFYLCSFGIANLVTKTSISPGFRTDHSAIKLDLSLAEDERGRGFWKLNCSHLSNREYVEEVKQVIRKTIEDNRDINDALKWEMIKLNVRGKSIEFSSRYKKQQEDKIKVLEGELNKLNKNQPLSALQVTEMENIQLQLESIVKQKAMGAKIRSRIRWYEEGEKSTRYFMNLEKRNFNLKTVNRVCTNSGTFVENRQDILYELKNFYSKLYTKTEYGTSQNEYQEFLRVECPTLDNDERDMMNNEITENELLAALKLTQNNKSPGSDGLPAEFYKMFWHDIKEPLLNSIKYAHQTGLLSVTQREGIITLMPKKGKDTSLIKNWRPLSLLNVDYKLIAKCVAGRIKDKLPKLINPAQTGSVKGRYIGENIIKILDILTYTEENEIPAILMTIDFEKAFDNVSWQFTEMCLKRLNFGEEVIKWFKILYNRIKCCVANNGWTTEFFEPSQGVRQGCPLSPYLFVLVVEFLGNHIRTNKKIKGIKVKDNISLIYQFADDTNLTLEFDLETLLEVEKTFSKFQKVSGLKVNYDKTEILRIGSLRHSDAKLITATEMCWTNDPVLVLGVTISTDVNELLSLNFDPLIPKIENQIKIWNMRELSLFGKSLIIKTMLMSQLVYKLSVLPTPSNEFIDKLQSLFFKFLWGNRRPKIKRAVLYSDKQNGGLSIPNIHFKNVSFKVAWVKRLLENQAHFLTESKFLHDQYFWKCNFDVKAVNQILEIIKVKSVFWKDVIQSWSEVNYKAPETADEIVSQILWFNSNIQIGKKVVYYPNLASRGIHCIKDLMNEHGIMDFNSFKNKYPRVTLNFVQYYGLIDAIPRQWKLMLINYAPQYTETPHPILSKMDHRLFTRTIYQISLQFFSLKPIETCTKWHEKIGHNLTEDDWEKTFLEIYQTTISTTLRAFQFKLLHQILATKRRLFLWKIKDSELCTFCKEMPETDCHLFIECPYTKEFWRKINVWYANMTGITVNLNHLNILFGQDLQGFPALNIVVLVAKHYLFQCSFNNKLPYLTSFIEKLKIIKDTEYVIAYKNEKLQKHNNKWRELQNI